MAAVLAVVGLLVLAGIPLSVADKFPFVLVGTAWGTASSPVEAGPGDQNVPLVVSIQYLATSR